MTAISHSQKYTHINYTCRAKAAGAGPLDISISDGRECYDESMGFTDNCADYQLMVTNMRQGGTNGPPPTPHPH
jgi:hypothetical protein